MQKLKSVVNLGKTEKNLNVFKNLNSETKLIHKHLISLCNSPEMLSVFRESNQ